MIYDLMNIVFYLVFGLVAAVLLWFILTGGGRA